MTRNFPEPKTAAISQAKISQNTRKIGSEGLRSSSEQAITSQNTAIADTEIGAIQVDSNMKVRSIYSRPIAVGWTRKLS
jgi:hypothetical protein